MQNEIKPQSALPTPAPAAPTAATASWKTKLQPSPWLLRKMLMLAILVGVGVGAFCWGRKQQVNAKDPNGNEDSPGGSGRVVAYLYDHQVPVTRAEFGEYLIARFRDRLRFMLNRKIVEMECRKAGVIATDAEVEHRFQKDLDSFGTPMTRNEFVNSILRRFGKTEFEWKEDVIRPKIMMEKLVKAQIKINETDIREGFDARYGPKVECRMIVIDKGNTKVAQQVWENARKGTAYFMDEAKKQFIPNLASQAGKVPPIHRHFGDKRLEEAAFRLKEGEISELIGMPDSTYVILLCEKHLPGNPVMRIDQVRQELAKEMLELRMAQRIPDVFAEMEKRAAPDLVLDNTGRPSHPVMAAPNSMQLPAPVSVKSVEMPPAPVPRPVTPPPGATPLLEPSTPQTITIAPPVVTPMPVIPVPVPTPNKK